MENQDKSFIKVVYVTTFYILRYKPKLKYCKKQAYANLVLLVDNEKC